MSDALGRAAHYVGSMITRRLALALSLAPFLAVALPAVPAVAEPISLAEISRYFNALTTAQGPFTQVNGDGSVSTGRIFIHRPGRVRFEYDPPEQSLVLAGGGQVAIFDARSNQGPTTYPLRRTPLNLILARQVNLGADRMVVAHYEEGATTSVVAQDPEHPEYGNIRLVFTAEPTELRQWVITDDMGRQTTVVLGALETGGEIRPSMFSVDVENLRRQGSGH